MTDRLQQQIAFLLEVDKLKQIFRQTYLLDETRKENDAEHSWHFAMFALILAEYAPEPVDILKVIKMALVHDLVEIDAGDTFLYDEAGNADKAEREAKAADRIFALLPEEQGGELRTLWEEFEEKKTPEAKFAGAMDRFQPFLHNCNTQDAHGKSTGSLPIAYCKATATSQLARPFYGIACKNWLMKWSLRDILMLGNRGKMI